MANKISLPLEAVESINRVLNKGNDVLIKYKQNKGEIEILEQKNTVSEKVKIK